MLRAISSGNRVDEKSGVQHTSTPFYNAFYFQQTEQASLKQLLGFALEGGEGGAFEPAGGSGSTTGY